jgi:C-terminal processing protease CtpA/Prc
VLPELIPSFVNAAGELAYKKTVLALIARVHDTHANILMADSALEVTRGMNLGPVIITFVEDKAVVTSYEHPERGPKTGLKKGDIITAINGKSVENIIKEELPFTPASNYSTQLRNISYQLLRTNDTVINITYQREKTIHTTGITCYPFDWENQYKSSKDTCFKYLTPDIGYIYPGTVKNEYLPAVMAGFMKTKGIIIDFRCYPADSLFRVLPEYLLPEPTPFSRFTSVNPTLPGLFVYDSCSKVGKKNRDCYKGKIVIIVNETTQSSAEYSTMAFRVTPGAKVLGSTTAAADGNVSKFYLPGGILTGMSGLGVYYPNGRETQRVGIIPDITIRPTIQGIIEGRDELLEKAIAIINGQ